MPCVWKTWYGTILIFKVTMSSLPEFVGTVHIFLGPYRGNPIALYLRKENNTCRISPSMYPWNRLVGTGETTNKAAADFEEKWKQGGLSPDMYTGPHWEGGIKPEKPKPAPPPPKPAAPPPPKPVAPPQSDTVGTPAPSAKVPTPEKDPPPSPSSSQTPGSIPPGSTDSGLG